METISKMRKRLKKEGYMKIALRQLELTLQEAKELLEEALKEEHSFKVEEAMWRIKWILEKEDEE